MTHRILSSLGLVVTAAALFSLPLRAEVNVYGYLSLYYENTAPVNIDGAENPVPEFDYKNLIVMINSQINDNTRAFISLKGADECDISTYWGEYQVRDFLKLRVGKLYRPFDLYNELLDAVPTYLGMEPPEQFDNDHLMLPRFGKVMVHGGVNIGADFLKYSYIMDSDEKMTALSADNEVTLSHGWDLNYNFRELFTIGHSGFIANEMNGSSKDLGDGSPRTGMLPWMATDKYNVFGGYLKTKKYGLSLEAAYYTSAHEAVRDPDGVAAVYANTTLNAAQLKTFFGDSDYSKDPDDNTVDDDVITAADFSVWTYYVRLGYTIRRGLIPALFLNTLELTPYAFLEAYSNPETIAEKDWGGDNEAGVADDGYFMKPTLGICVKPSPYVALKVDGSAHMYKSGGEDVRYLEMRADLSFFFK